MFELALVFLRDIKVGIAPKDLEAMFLFIDISGQRPLAFFMKNGIRFHSRYHLNSVKPHLIQLEKSYRFSHLLLLRLFSIS